MNRPPEPEYLNPPKNLSVLTDSLNKLESLVEANKITDKELAKIYSRHALSLALLMNREDALARAFVIMGIAYSNNNADSSFIFYSKALKIAQNFNFDRIKSKAIYNLAMVYLTASDQKSAVICLDSAIIVSQRAHDHELLSNAYNALGNVKFDLMDTLESKVMYDSAFNIAKRHNLARQTGIAIASLSRFEYKPGRSETMRKKAIEILREQPGNEEEIAMILNNLGMRSTNVDTAIRYYKDALKIAESGNCAEVEIAAYNNLAYSLIDKKDFIVAGLCLTKFAIPLAKKLENFDWLSSLYDSYADVLIADGKTEQALTNERLALKMRIKADRWQAANQLRLLVALLNVKNKELRIQTNEKELQGKDHRIQLMVYWFSISFMFLLLTILLVLWKMQRNKLKYQIAMLNSAKKLIDIEENMKGRVAMELHDLTSPFYTAMLQRIEQAHIGDCKVEQELKSRLSVMTESVRQISHRMDNNFIGQLSITELVTGLCEDLQRASSVAIHCKMQPDDINLPSEETIHIYRIVQEILTNAIKYVTFGEIKLSLSIETGMFFVLYQDSGPGFDEKKIANKGLGITNIFERSRIINGKAVLNTSPGKGTNWNIVIPYKEA